MQRLLMMSLSIYLLVVSEVSAVVDVSLNIRYNDPADISEGGEWTLVAKTNTADRNGLVGMSTTFSDIPASGFVDPNIGHDNFGGELLITPLGDDVQFTYSQDPFDGTITLGVGQVGGPSDLGLDPLGNPTWNNASSIATGTLPDGVRPVAVSGSVSEFDSSNNVVFGTLNSMVVRGDSIASQGVGDVLPLGDLNRDFNIDVGDLITVLNHFSGARDPSTIATDILWDAGNFDDDGDIDTVDVSHVVAGFTAHLPGDTSKNPALYYNPISGGVTLVPEGANVTVFQLTSGHQFNPLFSTDDLGDTMASTENETYALAWSSASALSGDGFGDSPEDEVGAFLGNVFPTGLDLEGLDNMLTGNVWQGPGGTGGAFDLVVSVGDFNFDGTVDGLDFLKWQSGDTANPWDAADLANWEANYGNLAQRASTAAVPEPAGFVLALAALVPLFDRRR